LKKDLEVLTSFVKPMKRNSSFFVRSYKKSVMENLRKHEIALEDFIISGIDRSKVASMIYSIYKNNGKGIVCS